MTKHVSKFLAIAGLSVLALLVVAVLPLFAHAQRLPQSQTEIDLSFAPLVREASPAVVNVFTERMVANRVSPMEQLFFGDAIPKQRRQNSLGSGVIVGSDGVIVTNNHVIDGADTFRVVLSDRREYPAELVLADERTDLAVLKIDTEGAVLPTLPSADTRAAQVGDLVLAIGNPFGVGQTVTSGIISATARTDVGISDYAFFLQTDAAVNPGNSGGALVNTKGELVGVNTAIFSRSGGSNGIGFAIPAEMVKRVVDAGMNEGTFVRPWLGLAAQSVSYDIAKAQGLDRPAVRSPGDEAILTVLRGGKTQNIGVTVEPPPGAREADIVLLDGRTAFSGARVVELSPRLAEENGLDPFQKGSGIYVHSVMRRSIARNFFRPGDIVRSVNGAQTKTVDELKSALAKDASSWDIEIERNGRVVRGTVRL